MSSRGRPSKIDKPTRINMVWPKTLANTINDLAEEKDLSRTELTRKILENYINFPIDWPEDLIKRLSAISDKKNIPCSELILLLLTNFAKANEKESKQIVTKAKDHKSEEVVLTLLKSNPGVLYTNSEIHQKTSIPERTVRHVTRNLAENSPQIGLIKKINKNHYYYRIKI
jgi:metal-responsive CopG/Arc/MetJ family transcriptional regulator